jgi:hypothetical protein
MVQAVRQGLSLRAVARRFRVSPGQVAFWVKRAAGRRLDRIDFSDRRPGPSRSPRRTAAALERRILRLRQRLRTRSVLGESGADAIERALHEHGQDSPARATINRILNRHGATDGAHRIRRPPPPPGWYLPDVAAGRAELDSFDLIEDLKIAGGPLVDVFTGVALHGHQVDAWPDDTIGTTEVLDFLLQRWRGLSLPAYAQFDNDTRFQGAHQFPDSIGRVSRLCLALAVVPVFAPPREHGFQNGIENFNGLWQSKVWVRWQHRDLATLQTRSERYVAEHRRRTAARAEQAPPRRPLPAKWRFNPHTLPRGRIVFLRRADDNGAVHLLGHTWQVSTDWRHRLVRCEVDLDAHRIHFYALRRRVPDQQPRLRTVPYHRPDRPFQGE